MSTVNARPENSVVLEVSSDYEFSELPAILHDEIEKKMHCPEDNGDPLCFQLARAVMDSLRDQTAVGAVPSPEQDLS